MPSDDLVVNFVISGVSDSCTARAGRFALSEVLKKAPEGCDSTIRDELMQLIKRRRARLHNLIYAGWNVGHPSYVFFLLNCPPPGVFTKPSTKYRLCKLRRFCPFCWSRLYTEDLFERLHYFYFNAPQPKDMSEFVEASFGDTACRMAHAELLEIQTTREFPCHKTSLMEIYTDLHKNRDTFIRRLNPIGAYQLYTVFPRVQFADMPNRWCVKHNVLALVSPNHPGVSPKQAEDEVYRSVRRANLFLPIPSDEEGKTAFAPRYVMVGATGRATLYPKELLYSPAEMMAEVIAGEEEYNRSRGTGGYLRLSTYYGVLRNRTEMARMAQMRGT